jgi:co-chaperonin GroES (HSP10)
MTATEAPINRSGVKPLGRAVLVEYYEPERKQTTIYIPEKVREHEVLVEQRAVVLEIGPAAWPDEPPRAKVGDRVLIARMSGYALKGPADGRLYRIVNDRDIFAAITHEQEESNDA